MYLQLIIQAADLHLAPRGQSVPHSCALLCQALRVWSLPGLNSPEHPSLESCEGQSGNNMVTSTQGVEKTKWS